MSKKGHINIGWPYRPGEVMTAQMNGSYAAAVTLIDGDAFIDQYDTPRLSDPAILALMPRIDFVHEPELDRGGAPKRHAVRIEALRKDGSILSIEIEQRRGSAEHPLNAATVEQKFRRLAAVALPPQDVEDLMRLIGAVEREVRLDRLTGLVAKRPV
jgi:aconitate decarboxylase